MRGSLRFHVWGRRVLLAIAVGTATVALASCSDRATVRFTVPQTQSGTGAVQQATTPPESATPDVPAQTSATVQGTNGIVEIGLSDSPGGAAALHQAGPYALRYQYLAGGVNTGHGWATWNPDGAFVTAYIQESVANGLIPVFSYYMLLQSNPGSQAGEAKADAVNLQTVQTMTAYYQDLVLFFQKAAAFPSNRVILHVEPDLWGYLEEAGSGRASAMPVKVADTGLPDLAGLPNTAAGFAQAIVKLRDTYAPNVLLAYHLSVWGTGDDILYSRPATSVVNTDAQKAVAFYQSLGAGFDLVFTDASDRDAAFKQFQYHDGGASWWGSADYARNALFLGAFHDATQLPIVIWQIPLGNTKMRAENNTWGHYQDNHVETLLGDPSFATLQAYARAGVVALLFGGGADGVTCACDATKDGVTNPAPINGNTMESLSADDDGGYFKQQVVAYYAAGGVPLP